MTCLHRHLMSAIGGGCLIAGALAVWLAAARPATAIAAGPATQPATAPANLVTVPGVTLTKTARTQEEEEEQQGTDAGGFSRSSSFFGGSKIDGTGTPEQILREFSHFGGPRLIVKAKLPTIQFHIVAHAGSDDALLTKIAQAFSEAFKVRVVRETREIDVLAIEADPEKIKALPKVSGFGFSSESSGNGDATEGKIKGSMADVARFVEDQLNVPVVDKTKLSGSYEVHAHWTNGKARVDITASLAEQGLKLVPAKAKVEAIFVEVAPQATAPAGSATQHAATAPAK